MEEATRLVKQILELARRVHLSLGPGFVENIYSRALVYELKAENLRVEREKHIKIWYGAQLVGRHVLDFVVNDHVILELKSSRAIIPLHAAQMKSYLQASRLSVGLILNFGAPDLEWELIRSSTELIE
jgi:GxxExxY protein